MNGKSDSKSELLQLRKALDETAIVAITDAKGKIKFVNDKFCQISKYSKEELLGQDHRIVNSGFHSKAFMKALWKTIASGKVWKGVIKNRNKTGEYYWVDTTIVPFVDETKKIHEYVSIRYDITRLKEIENQLNIAKDQAESANKIKSAFLANMSHELRTPLNGILGSANYLSTKVNDLKLKTMIDLIIRSGSNLLELINNILDLSKIEANKIQIVESEINLPVFIQELSSIFSIFRTTNQVEFQVNLSADLPTSIIIDPQRLRQILTNLLENSFKFTEEGSVILNVLPGEREFQLIFEVKDTGIGIEAEHQKSIFKPFQQQPNQDPKYRGTGLGLSISNRLVQRMGGCITLKSKKRVGSEFRVIIPYKSLA